MGWRVTITTQNGNNWLSQARNEYVTSTIHVWVPISEENDTASPWWALDEETLRWVIIRK